MIQLIPALIVARLFIDGEAEFGVVTQSAMAFAQLMGAFSLIVTQFQSISTYTAVISRLGTLVDSMQDAAKHDETFIEVCEDCGVLGYEQLTLRAPDNATILVKDLSLRIPRGTNVLIDGHHEAAKTALFRATAGVWDHGDGKVIRPMRSQIAFLTERPYLHPGTLREILGHMQDNAGVTDEEIIGALRLVGLEALIAESGGLGEAHDWNDRLSLGTQQLLAVARLLISRVEFAVMDHLATALNPSEADLVLSLLKQRGITYLTFGNSTDNPTFYDGILDIDEDGKWHWQKGLVVKPATLTALA
jgi:putative ATP-binding cassette transporter